MCKGRHWLGNTTLAIDKIYIEEAETAEPNTIVIVIGL